MLNLLKIQERISKKFKHGYGEKENEIHNMLKEKNIYHEYIKEQGFIIPSTKKPKRVILTKLNHPTIYNTAFDSKIFFNIVNKSEKSLHGGMNGILNVSLLLNLINKELIEETIIVFLDDDDSLHKFLNSINEDLKEELIYIYLGLSHNYTEKTALIKPNSKHLKDYVKKELNYDIELSIQEEYRSLKFLSIFIPVKTNTSSSSKISLSKLDGFINIFKNLFKLSYDVKLEDREEKYELTKEELKTALNEFNFNNDEFIIKYILTKYKEKGTVHIPFLATKENKKDILKLMESLEKYGLEKYDEVYKF